MGGPFSETPTPPSGGRLTGARDLSPALILPPTGHPTLCRTNDDARPAARIESHSEDEVAQKSKRGIICAVCGYGITSEDQRIRVNGSHDHRCVNPHGLMFHIGCFRAATGCNTSGPPTTEFTWFRGFAWSVALCRGCNSLLGWQYERSELFFFGLILDRLVVGEEPSH